MPELRFMKIEKLATHPEAHVTALELAEYLNCSEDLIYKFVRNDQLDVTRIGRRISIKTESAQRCFNERPDGQARD